MGGRRWLMLSFHGVGELQSLQHQDTEPVSFWAASAFFPLQGFCCNGHKCYCHKKPTTPFQVVCLVKK